MILEFLVYREQLQTWFLNHKQGPAGSERAFFGDTLYLRYLVTLLTRDCHAVSVYAYSFGYVHLQLMRIGFPHPHETKMKSPKIVIFGGYYLAKICKFWAINTISDTQYHFWAKTR